MQDVSEEVVVAVPAPVAVERDEEQVRPVQGLEHRSATPAAGALRQGADRVAQRPGEPVEDRGVEQEAPYVVGLSTEDLVGEVVDDEPVVASEPGDEAGAVVAVAQRERRQLEGGDPPLGACLECCEVRGREVKAVEVVEVAGDLLTREAKVGGADLDELPACPQPGERQRRVGPGADGQPKLRRLVVDEEGHPGRDIDTVSEVVVVEDEGDLTRVHAELVHHAGEHGLHRRLPRLQKGERMRHQSQVRPGRGPGERRSRTTWPRGHARPGTPRQRHGRRLRWTWRWRTRRPAAWSCRTPRVPRST